MAWRVVGAVTLTAQTVRARVGYVQVPPFGGVELRVRQTSGYPNFPMGFFLLYLENTWGRELGTIKAWAKTVGECYRLGSGLSSMVGGGLLWAEPRAYNRRWMETMGAVGLEVWADETSDLPSDRYQAPGLVDGSDRGLPVVRAGSLGRVRF
jgi:hypothetical protein